MTYMVTDAVKLGTLLAGADLSGNQYYAVKVSAGVVVLAGAGELAIGSLQNKPESGQVAELQIGGVAKFIAGAVIANNAQVAVGSGGKLVTATTGAYVMGIALAASAADGDTIPVLMPSKNKLDPESDPRTNRESQMFVVAGTISALTELGGGWEAPAAGAITRVCAYRKTAGSAGSTIADVNIGGTTIFTTQANRPEIAWDEATEKDVATTIEAGTLAAGDMVTMDIDQVDSAGTPADLTVIVTVEYSA